MADPAVGSLDSQTEFSELQLRDTPVCQDKTNRRGQSSSPSRCGSPADCPITKPMGDLRNTNPGLLSSFGGCEAANSSSLPGVSDEISNPKDMIDSVFSEKEPQISSADEADDSTCAICLKRIQLADIAQPVGCDHVYCTCCLLHWASFKEKPWCPQCNMPFASIHTFRKLDGHLHDNPVQESIALLKCTEWFRDYVRMKESKAAAASSLSRISTRPEGAIIDESDYVDYSRYYQEFDDDEEVEDYYYSSAAGRARIVIGNRRHGPNGYMSSGRMQARPAPAPQTPKGKGKGAQDHKCTPKSAPAKGQGSTPASAQRAGKKKKPSIRLDTDDESDDAGPSRRNQSMGRRARRNQRKAAADLTC